MNNAGHIYVSDSTLVDYEQQSVYHLVVEAASAVETNPAGEFLAYTKVIVALKDINDNEPQFLQQLYTTAVHEGLAKGSFVLQVGLAHNTSFICPLHVSAVDADAGENAGITYSIVSGNQDSAFAIDMNGNILTNMQLDREIVDEYKLTIMATDGGARPMSGTTIVHVKGFSNLNFQIDQHTLF